ncbi:MULTISPECIES: hypothetical protein [Acinetobacter]|uniref:hypothetical protein n=1 Tax=Acinetobacter TaxID=469 RepID=UPI000993DBA9|nr:MULTISPECIES: hypothetical protein [Acinetobacter]MCL6243391.1 hypothetical protein [Acinetobacter amyesii]OOV83841.1 hypothetical protein B1201_00930 [Acinetobacter sp. ANC 5600]
MSEFEEFFKIKFPNIQATIDQTHSEESILLKKACRMIWDARQAEIDQLKAEKEGLEKERDDAIYLKNEHRNRRCQLANKLTQKSLRLTDAEMEYKRIKGLQARDCLQIMRLTAKNERLNDELKVLRGDGD